MSPTALFYFFLGWGGHTTRYSPPQDLAEVCKRDGAERAEKDVDRVVGLGSSRWAPRRRLSERFYLFFFIVIIIFHVYLLFLSSFFMLPSPAAAPAG